MKNLRRDGYFQKKYGKYTGDKWNSSKLDRKSSRGMIYENEELRLRTININAEVERGQSDIRKLRRENEQLRREIWSLRDEYDRLNKLLKTHKTTENDANNSGSSHTEESDSCDTCREEEIDEEIIENDECLENKFNKKKQKQKNIESNLKIQEISENYENLQKTEHSTDEILGLETYPETFSGGSSKQKENLHVNFDHLSIVSEENLTNSDGNSVQQGDIEQVTIATMPLHGINNNEQQKFIEMQSHNRLSDIQSVAPPLSHFENIPYDKMGPIMATSLEDVTCSTSTTTTGETVIPANGWDFGVPSYALHTAKSSDPLKIPSNVSQKSLKHFFSPIKPRNRIEPRQSIESSRCGAMPAPSQSSSSSSPAATNSAAIRIGPDVFVSNALASPYHRQNLPQGPGSSLAPFIPGEPVYATVQKSSSSRTISPLSFQKGGNLEELLSDIETLSNDILQMQLEKQKSFSQEKLFSGDNLTPNRKPYRSEMNLILSYNGSNPVITPITKGTISSSTTALDKSNPYNIEGTPPAKLPEPMILFPQNLTYLGFENYSQLPCGSTQSQDSTYSTTISKYSKDYEQIHVVQDGAPPPFHSLGYLPAEKERAKGEIEQEEVPLQATTISSSSSAPPTPATTTISTTPGRNLMRRKFFTKHLEDQQGPSRASCDSNQHLAVPSTTATAVPQQGIFERMKMTRTESSTSENANCDSSSGSETIKRKSRRVSILFKRPDDKIHEKSRDKRTTEENTIANKTIALLSESAANLPTALDSETLMTKKAAAAVNVTHSTPNSPHSGGRRLNHSGSSGHHHHHSHHHHHHHLQQQHHQNERKSSQDSGSKEPLLGGSSGGSGGGGGTQLQHHQQRTKCSRRHSDGTVGPPASGVLHASSSNHGLNENYHEPGTSMSERNSNSLASSRESSTSLSMRSQRRKISVSSHNGGKIPWCGCWGNGCV